MYQNLRAQLTQPPTGQLPLHECFHQDHYPSCPNFDPSMLHELQNAPVPGKLTKEQVEHHQNAAPTFENLYGGDYATNAGNQVYDYSSASQAADENLYDEILDSEYQDHADAKAKVQPDKLGGKTTDPRDIRYHFREDRGIDDAQSPDELCAEFFVV